jgi:hypothetical protein
MAGTHVFTQKGNPSNPDAPKNSMHKQKVEKNLHLIPFTHTNSVQSFNGIQ